MRPKKANGVWDSADVLEAEGLLTIADTIAKQQSNIAKTIKGRQVLKECREAERRRPPLPLPPASCGGTKSSTSSRREAAAEGWGS